MNSIRITQTRLQGYKSGLDKLHEARHGLAQAQIVDPSLIQLLEAVIEGMEMEQRRLQNSFNGLGEFEYTRLERIVQTQPFDQEAK